MHNSQSLVINERVMGVKVDEMSIGVMYFHDSYCLIIQPGRTTKKAHKQVVGFARARARVI